MDYNKLMPNATIGIIGAGQLGKMLAQSAQKMGYRVHMYDPNPQACGFGVCHESTCASFDDQEALIAFAQKVDVLTYEFENINGQILQLLSETAYLPQGTQLLLTAQNRIAEKQWLDSVGVPVVDYAIVNSIKDLDEAVKQIGLPAIIKTTRLGYDGKGQIKLSSFEDLNNNHQELTQLIESECIYEKLCQFDYEFSVMVARDIYGHIETFPVAYNVHEKGVLATSIAPAPFDEQLNQKAQELAQMIAEKANLIGVLGIEFFVKGSELVVNELAPRPHNTGHYTIEACNVSQYDQHILAICGRPIMSIDLLHPALMVNIMGQHLNYLEEAMTEFPQAVFHLYDKGKSNFQRKMGHFTLLEKNQVNLLSMVQSNALIKKWRQSYHQ